MRRKLLAATPDQVGDGEDRLVDVHAPEVPQAIRQAVLQRMEPGHALWRCPRRAGPGGLLGLLAPASRRPVVIEWWLVDAAGELVEAFWEEE